MTNWRPLGWDNPYSEENIVSVNHAMMTCTLKNGYSTYEQARINLYKEREAGADAMLSSLMSQEHADWLSTEEGQSSKGEWYYIPDQTPPDDCNREEGE